LVKQILADRERYNKYKNYEKMFLLMAIEHSEKASDGLMCIKEMEQLASDNKEKMPDFVSKMMEGEKGLIQFAKDHYKVIEKFGRYPVRNIALNRENTPEETEYLKTAKTF
jgi:uncharacterized protein (DUF924 family)